MAFIPMSGGGDSISMTYLTTLSFNGNSPSDTKTYTLTDDYDNLAFISKSSNDIITPYYMIPNGSNPFYIYTESSSANIKITYSSTTSGSVITALSRYNKQLQIYGIKNWVH